MDGILGKLNMTFKFFGLGCWRYLLPCWDFIFRCGGDQSKSGIGFEGLKFLIGKFLSNITY